MAKRYHDEIDGLINSLNEDEERTEAIELIRDLIEKIVLTPTTDDKGLKIDLYGDMAEILSHRNAPRKVKNFEGFINCPARTK